MANPDRVTLKLRPLEHIYRMDVESLLGPLGAADWRSMNVDVDQHSIKKRCGYISDRTLESLSKCLHIAQFGQDSGERYTVMLDEDDLMLRETASGKTFSYRTPVYTTGTVSSISTNTVTGSGTSWNTDSNVKVGDWFIMDDDWGDSQAEPDTQWARITAINSDTEIELENNYTKNGTAYTIRQTYTVPSGERYNFAVIDDKFIFTNRNINTQLWDGTANKSVDLDAVNAVKAKFCIDYMNRLVLADLESPLAIGASIFTGSGLDDCVPGGRSTNAAALNYVIQIDGNGTPDTFKWSDDGGSTWDATTVDITGESQTLNNAITCVFDATTGHTIGDKWAFTAPAVGRNPWRLTFSVNGDPTNLVGLGAGSTDLIDTMDRIAGLGKVGSQLIIFKENSYYVGRKTNDVTNPLSIPTHKKGVGCIAPYSIVQVEGTVAWLGRDDFYMMEGDHAKPIGESIRHLFYKIVEEDALSEVWGMWNPAKNHVLWFAETTTDGQVCFVWDYKNEEWMTYNFWDTIYGGGAG